MILAAPGLTGGIGRERRRRGLLARRQTLGHNLLNGLVEWWPLNEQSGGRRGVHGGLHLADNNTVTGGDGVGSLASQFTSANSEYLSRTSEAALQTGDIDFTFAAWVYPEAIDAAGKDVAGKTSTTSEWFLETYIDSGNNIIRLRIDGAADLNSAEAAYTLHNWHLLIAWHDAVNDMVYTQIDNENPRSAATTGAPSVTADPFVIGRAVPSRYFDGRIQRAGLWKRVLTSDERTWLYNGGRGRDYPFV